MTRIYGKDILAVVSVGPRLPPKFKLRDCRVLAEKRQLKLKWRFFCIS